MFCGAPAKGEGQGALQHDLPEERARMRGREDLDDRLNG